MKNKSRPYCRFVPLPKVKLRPAEYWKYTCTMGISGLNGPLTLLEESPRKGHQFCHENLHEVIAIATASIRWQKGKLDVSVVWRRPGIDIIHSGSAYDMTLVDCAPMRFVIWRPLTYDSSKLSCFISKQV